MLRVMFNSDYFKQARFSRVRSPAELIVNTIILRNEFIMVGLVEKYNQNHENFFTNSFNHLFDFLFQY